MQIISVLATLILCVVIMMNFHETVTVNAISNDFAQLLHASAYSKAINLALYSLCLFILGEISAIFFFAPLYNSLKNKFNAYKRELERGSISNTTAEAKIGVLENKITVLEKALDEALKKKN